MSAQAGDKKAVALDSVNKAKIQFEVLDANQDGSLSKDEAASSTKVSKVFDSLDADKNGKLDINELGKLYSGRK